MTTITPEQQGYNLMTIIKLAELTEPLRLDIGCGTMCKSGFIGVDAYVKTDIQALMWDIPLDDRTVSEIYSSHALEHVGAVDVDKTLKEWWRILKPGGRLELHIPDLEWCCHNYLAHPDSEWALMFLFGMQTHEGEVHRTGFTKKSATNYLIVAGFHLLDFSRAWSHEQQEMIFICERPSL